MVGSILYDHSYQATKSLSWPKSTLLNTLKLSPRKKRKRKMVVKNFLRSSNDAIVLKQCESWWLIFIFFACVRVLFYWELNRIETPCSLYLQKSNNNNWIVPKTYWLLTLTGIVTLSHTYERYISHSTLYRNVANSYIHASTHTHCMLQFKYIVWNECRWKVSNWDPTYLARQNEVKNTQCITFFWVCACVIRLGESSSSSSNTHSHFYYILKATWTLLYVAAVLTS